MPIRLLLLVLFVLAVPPFAQVAPPGSTPESRYERFKLLKGNLPAAEGEARNARLDEIADLFEELVEEADQGRWSDYLAATFLEAGRFLRDTPLPDSPLPFQEDDCFELALEASRNARDVGLEAETIYSYGTSLQTRTRAKEAREVFLQGVELEHAYRAYIKVRLAASFRADHEWGEAHRWLREGIAEAEANPTDDELARRVVGESFLYHQALGLLDHAWADLQEERRLVARLPESALRRGNLVWHELEYYLMTDGFEQVKETAENYIAASPGSRYLDRVYYSQGLSLGERAYLDHRHRAPAIELLKQALDFENPAGRHLTDRERVDIEVHLAEMHAAEGDRVRALEWVEAAERRIGSLEQREGSVRLRSAARGRMLARWLTITGDASDTERREALEEMRLTLEDLLREWRTVPASPSGTGFLHTSTARRIVARLLHATLLVESGPRGIERAVEDLARVQAERTLARRLKVPEDLSIEEIRSSLLSPGHGLLVYLPAPERGLVFAIDDEGAQVAEIEPWIVLHSLRGKAMGDLVRRPRPGVESLPSTSKVHDLAKHLVPESLHEMIEEWDAVTVTGLDLVGWIPFDALPIFDDRPIGLTRAIDVLPSIPVGIHLATRRAKREIATDFLFLGVPTPDPETARRYQVDDLEAAWTSDHPAALRRASGGRPLRLFTGAEATRDRLRDGSLDGVGFLHVLTHGVFNSKSDPDTLRDRPAGLLLAPTEEGDEGIAWCADVEAGSPAPSLVLLSACGAANAPMRTGDDGASHLGGAFLAAGADTVVLSRDPLDFDATLELSTRFTEHLSRGDVSPARALQRARADLVAEHPGWSHPFYYGLLQTSGVGHAPLRMPALPADEGSGSGRLLAIGAVLLLIAGGILGVRLARSRGRRAA